MARVRIMIFAVLCVLAATPALGGPETRLQNAYRKAKGVDERVKVVLELGNVDTKKSAALLREIAEGDPDDWIRRTAVAALGKLKHDCATELLFELLPEGGSAPFRKELILAVVRRTGGRDRLIEILKKGGIRPHRKAVLVEMLSHLDDPVTLHLLYRLAESDQYILRTGALRALGPRLDAADDLPLVLARILKERSDSASLLCVLDLIEARPYPNLLPVLEKLPPMRDPRVTEAVDHAIKVIKIEKWKEIKRLAELDGYDPPKPPVTPPKLRPRYDLVYAFDATGSMKGIAGRVRRIIAERVKELGGVTSDIRVGLVVFRQTKKGVNWKSPDVVPLTHDLSLPREFLITFDHNFVADSQGAAIYHGLHLGLDRMPYRANVVREFTIFCDTKCHDYELCRRAVLRHANDVKIRIVWCGGKVPRSISKLAQIAGTEIR